MGDLTDAVRKLTSYKHGDLPVCIMASHEALDGEFDLASNLAKMSGNRKWSNFVINNSGETAKNPILVAFTHGAPFTTDLLMDSIAHFERWIEPRLASELNVHIRNGACLIFAIVSNAVEEMEAYRTLIRYAADKVQLHDVSL